MMYQIASRERIATRRHFAYAALVLALGFPAQAALALSYTCSAPNVLQSFTNTSVAGTDSGSVQSFVVPSNILTIDAAGAQGGVGISGGGFGAEVSATFSVVSGQTLCVVVGVEGSTSNGVGGGGGGSFVYAIASGTCASNLALVSTSAAPNLLIAAAGGGGSGETAGISGRAPTGAGTSGASAGTAGDRGAAGAGGFGGNGGGAVYFGGGGGGLLTDGGSAHGAPGGMALINGGAGGTSTANGGFGGGGAAFLPGGGGGGYNGGGAGGDDPGSLGGGGGGGSYTATAPLAPFTQSGVQTGNGAVNFCYAGTTPVRLQDFRVE
jgi:hypothetical protein